MRTLDKSWRLICTALAFAGFAGGACVLWALIFPLLALGIRSPDRRRRAFRAAIGLSFQFFLGALQFLRVLSLECHGLQELRQCRGCLMLANHPSLLDYVILTSLLPQNTCMVKTALLHSFFMGGVIRHAAYLPNTGAEDLLDKCRESLQRGDNILIFPEGTRTANSGRRLQRGAANIALRCRADVCFIHLTAEPPVLDKVLPWYAVPERRPHFTVRAGRYLPYADFACDSAAELPSAVRRLNALFARTLFFPS